MSPADTCRERGWVAGTVLEDAERPGHVRRIRITAIGEQAILARCLPGYCTCTEHREALWGLDHAMWKPVAP